MTLIESEATFTARAGHLFRMRSPLLDYRACYYRGLPQDAIGFLSALNRPL
jgi:hypothetical protein